jgi:hypothetical protein
LNAFSNETPGSTIPSTSAKKPEPTGALRRVASDVSISQRTPEARRPTKKRKLNSTAQESQALAEPPLPTGWVKEYDATGLVPQYTDPSQVPAHLQKCTYFP